MSLIIPKLSSMSTSLYESHGLLHLNDCIKFTNVMDKMSLMSDSMQTSETYRVPYKFALQDHNYGAPPPRTPSPPVEEPTNVSILETTHNEIGVNSDIRLLQSSPNVSNCEEPEHQIDSTIINVKEEDNKSESQCEGDEEQDLSHDRESTHDNIHVEEESITRCICEFNHDDGYMICCDRCFVWQHVDCMGLDRSNIPEEYLCELCQPRKIDKERAMSLQIKKRQELGETSSSEDEDDLEETEDSFPCRRKPDSKKSDRGRRRNSKSSTRGRRPHKDRRLEGPNKKPTRRPSRKSFRSGKRGHHNDDVCLPVPSQTFQLRDWIDNYEEAVTNHYSPELRARINNWKANGLSSNLKSGNQGQRCRVEVIDRSNPSSPHSSGLIALFNINQDQSIIEYRGKYLLLSQFKRQNAACRQYHPFVLHYQLTPGLDICVDARKYANDARFVRKSCRPNAEIKHVLDKGSIHLYIVATTHIHKDDEITIPHDKSWPGHPSSCACGETECGLELGLRKNGLIADTAKKKKRLSGDLCADDLSDTNSKIKPQPPKISKVKEVKEEEDDDSENAEDLPSPHMMSGRGRKKDEDKSSEKKKLTREERKMEAIMKAFERLEKLEQKKRENQSQGLGTGKRSLEECSSKGEPDDNDSSRDDIDKDAENSSGDDNCDHKPKPRAWRRGRRTSCTLLPSQRIRINSGSSDITSPDEASHNSISSFIDSMQSSPPGGHAYTGFRFPNIKKAIVNEWLSSPIDSSSLSNNVETSVRAPSPQPQNVVPPPGCGARPKSPPAVPNLKRSLSEKQVEGSAKKRWLRQAISEECEIPVSGDFCESPNSQADSPQQDYVTPLKKRRILRVGSSLAASSSCEPRSHNAKNSLSDEGDESCPSDEGGDSELLQYNPVCEHFSSSETTFKMSPTKSHNCLSEIEEGLNCVASQPQTVPLVHTPTSDTEMVQDVKCTLIPTPKRKISILDYRKRKQVKVPQPLNPIQLPSDGPGDPQCDSDASSALTPTPQDESYQEIVEELHQELLPQSHPVPSSEDKMRKDDIKWDSAPTLAELQQENVIERLKKEFGFKINKDCRTPAATSSLLRGEVQSDSLVSEEKIPSYVSCVMTKPPSPPPLPPPVTPPPLPSSPPLPSTSTSSSPQSPVTTSPNLNQSSVLCPSQEELESCLSEVLPTRNDMVPSTVNCSPTSVISAPLGVIPNVTKCDQTEHSNNDQIVTINRISSSPFCRSDPFSGILIEPGQPPPPGTNPSSVLMKYKLSKNVEDSQCKLNKRLWPT